jgi:hypothetical protein
LLKVRRVKKTSLPSQHKQTHLSVADKIKPESAVAELAGQVGSHVFVVETVLVGHAAVDEDDALRTKG